MLKWLRNRLKWWIAADEMAEVERWRVRCGEYDRWLASYPDIALVLQNLRAMAGGAGCTSNIAVDVPWIGPDAGPWNINGLRVHVARIRALASSPPPPSRGYARPTGAEAMNAMQWAGTLIGGAGFIVFGWATGWMPALGLFLALWGYGLQRAGLKERKRASSGDTPEGGA